MLGLRILRNRAGNVAYSKSIGLTSGAISSGLGVTTSSLRNLSSKSLSVLDINGKAYQNIFSRFPSPDRSLYDKKNEKDSCGVGLVANMKKAASRQIVLDANQMLVRMSHRGGCGCEVNTGDGAGNPFSLLCEKERNE